ncbi:MAG TPA: tetratricopeptide repeat protein [Candidatus Udaeobacter sp.]|nr:tetratricopeptide repeat protein [Candidatus Udaeobacter sp.]
MQTLRILPRIVTLALTIILVAGCSKEAKKTRFLAEADNFFKAGDYDKAKVSYLNVIRLDPQNALAFARIGAVWLEEGAPLRAAEFLTKASQLDPSNTEYHTRLADAYLALGRFADAKKEALQVLEVKPDSGDAIIALTKAAQSKEDVEEAEQRLQKIKKESLPFYLASANLSLRQSNLSAAQDALQRALTNDPQSSVAHMAMGDFYLLKKDQKQAGEEFKKAAELAPIRSLERLKYAAFASAIGDLQETRRISTEMTRQAPDYLPGWTLLAELAFKEKKYDEALSLLENVFSRDPENVDGRRLEGSVLLAKGDTKKGLEVLERLDRTYPDTPLIKYELAQAYLKSNNLSQARVVLDQVISTNPNYADAVLLLAEINLRSGHGEAVIEPLTRLLNRNPELKSAALLLAAAYGSLDRFDDAVVVVSEQAKLAPHDPQAQMALGLTLRQAKRNGEARQAFEKVAELAPDSLWPVEQLVELDLLDKHFDAARQRVRHQFQKTPDSAGAHFFEGKILAAEEKWDLAEAELRKALQLDPNLSNAYDLLVQAYLTSNKLPQALDQLQAQLAKNPDDMSSLMTLALLYERTNDFVNARNAYERLLKIDPNSTSTLNNLAYLYADRLNDLNKAYDLARKARDLQANDPAIADTFGWILSKRGDYQKALPILQDSAAKLPDSPEVQFHLGMTAFMMGRTDLARVALQKAAGAAKDFPGKEESKRRLALINSGAASELSLPQLEAMAKEQPNDVTIQVRLGEAYEKQGTPDKAAAAFEQAIKLNPGLTLATKKLAQLYGGPLQNKEKALVYAKKARELTPNDPQVTSLLGKAAYQAGNFAWSYSLFQEAARQRQSDPSLLHDLGWAAYMLGKVSEAREIMQKAVATSPVFPELADAKKFLTFTAFIENAKELGRSESEIEKELRDNAEYLPALMAKAALDEQRGLKKPAADIYTGILGRFPDFASAQKRLAMLYAEEPSTTTAAYDLAAQARKALPDDAQLTQLLGRLSYEKKEYQRAIQLLQESARKEPLNANSLFYLGMSQLEVRQMTEARDALNQALVAGLRDPFAAKAKRALANGQQE